MTQQYSNTLNFLIEAGASLTYKNASKEKMNDSLDIFFKENSLNGQDLTSAIAQLESDMCTSRNLLDSPELLRVSPSHYFTSSTSIWPAETNKASHFPCKQGFRVYTAFLYFDLTAYLYTVLTECDALTDLFGSNYDVWLSQVKLLYDTITWDWNPSWPRLIPYNELRNEHKNNIPAQLHYFFPWYTKWSGVSADSLQILVSELALSQPPSLDNVLIEKILQDEVLFKFVTKEALEEEGFLIGAPIALKKVDGIPLHLLLIADRQARKTPMPVAVKKVSRITVAILLLIKDGFTVNWNYAKYRAAFCGIGLSRERRMAWMEEIEPLFQEGSQQPSWFTSCFENWKFDEFSTDKPFAERMFADWMVDMEKIAATPLATLLELKCQFWEEFDHITPEKEYFAQSVIALFNLPLNFVTRILSLKKQWWHGMAEWGQIHFSRRFALGDNEQQDVPDSSQLKIDLNSCGDIVLPVPDVDIDDDGRGNISRQFVLLSGSDQEADTLRPLCDELKQVGFYWTLEYTLATGVSETHPVQSGSIPLIFPLDDLNEKDEIKMVILAIAPDTASLKNIFSGREGTRDRAQDSEEQSVIIKIFIKSDQ